ncbi:hypothetical protein Lalb_Chr17g0343531 [Lupinus albus]|uniref:Uncharacterized protein n=1 Tax=Lupinus albus TaxID=3870 RepID=A0A6A4P7Y0_LUPAL|nr:hypothetical protein Lalb_Chr17g0343531 [Lupinus albus]
MVTASAWINDLRDKIEQTRILRIVYRSASALGSRLPSIATARAKVAGAGAILQPVSNGTQVVMKRAKSMAQVAWTRPNLNLSSWSCMGPRRRAITSHSNTKGEASSPRSSSSANEESSDPLICSPKKGVNAKNMNLPVSSYVEEWSSEIECANERNSDAKGNVNLDDGEHMTNHDRYEDQVTEVELWQQLEQELYDRPDGEVEEIREEEAAAIAEVNGGQTHNSAPEMKEVHRFFPAGKIMHIVTFHSDADEPENDSSSSSTSSDSSEPDDTKIGIFLTPRSLYSKIRLSQNMISDHFMPVYSKQIESLIKELKEDSAVSNHVLNIASYQ